MGLHLLRVSWGLGFEHEDVDLIEIDGLKYGYSLNPIDDVGVSIFDGIEDDELMKKHLVSGLTRILNPPSPKDLSDIMVNLIWKKPTFGEFFLVFDVNSFQCNHPQDPEEWDMTVDCVGVLDHDYKITKVE